MTETVERTPTPGPWWFGGTMLTPAGALCVEAKEGDIAWVNDDFNNGEANSHLIIAAPKLLTACKLYWRLANDPEETKPTNQEVYEAVKDALLDAGWGIIPSI